ncbi:alanine racemase [Hydrogenimonas sp.]
MSDRKPYEKPTIIRIESSMSKAGVPTPKQRVRQTIGGVKVDELVERFGSPLFVFDEADIRRRYRRAFDAFSSRYPNVQFGWSYKTNYLKAVCAVFHSEGAIAEVVSEFEYEKARELGIEGRDIIFNGPYKPYDALLRAAKEEAKIHIDTFDEINDLERVADELGRQIPVAIRLNMDTGIYPQWSRFGFNIESGQAMDAVKRIKAGGKLILTGLHAHIGTFMLDANAYKVETAKMVQLMNAIEEQVGFTIDYIDVGGGFASKNHLRGIYQPPEVVVPSIDDYAEAITSALYENIKGSSYPKLYLETGRHLIDEAGYLITSVVASKTLPDSRRSYIVDAGVNLLYTYFWYKFNIELAREVGGISEPAMINGPLCMNIDVIDESILLPRLRRGDKLIISPVGAYNVTQWMQFIRYRPRVLMVMADGSVEIIREQEDLSDIERREILPDRLKLG